MNDAAMAASPFEVVAENRTETSSELIASGEPKERLLIQGEEAYHRWFPPSGPEALEATLRNASAMPTFAIHLVAPPTDGRMDDLFTKGLEAVAERVVATALWAFDGEGFVIAQFG
ncbi:MAG: hypothetical protein ACO1SV_05490 [Fimbriimonas sp.]